MKQHDNSEAMRLADYARGDEYQRAAEDAVDLIRQQSERIAELEARVHTCGPTCSKAGCINRRVTAERDQLRAEVERTSNNRDMWKGQCERQAEQLAQMRAEVERLRADGERLDWLEKCPATQLPKDSEAMRRWLWHRPAGAGNIRAAIDAARTTHKETE